MPSPQGLVQKRQGYATEPIRKAVMFFTPLRWIQLLSFILVFVIFQNCAKSPRIQSIDNKVYDRFLKAQSALKTGSPIVYIGIDRKSLQSIRPFPWPKRYYAAMARILREWGAKAIVFNLFFSEAGDTAEDNGALLEEFKRTNNLYLPVSFESEGFRNYFYANQSDPIFAAQAKALGHINYSQDPDGVIRRVFPYVKFNQKLLPHLGIQVAYDHLGKVVPTPQECDLPRDRNNNLLIHWTQRWNNVAGYYPFSDILNAYALLAKGQTAPVDPKDFKGKICLIGLTASDFKKTPLEAASPGIGVTGNIINTVLSGKYIRVASAGTETFLLLIVAVLSVLLFLPFRDIFSMIGGSALAGLWMLAAFLAFTMSNLWLGVTAPVLLILVYFLISFILAKITEYRERLYFLDLAVRDELTGLYAMRYISVFLSRAMSYARTFKKPFSVILLDIDDFRKINDTYGYRIGNMTLKKVAEVIQNSIRFKGRAMPDIAVAGRYGDEEFIVLLVGFSLATATFGISERIRKEIEKTEFHAGRPAQTPACPCPTDGRRAVGRGEPRPALQAGEQTFKVSASAGIAVLKPGEKDPQKVVERAQEALLKAKAEGKNRTCLSND